MNKDNISTDAVASSDSGVIQPDCIQKSKSVNGIETQHTQDRGSVPFVQDHLEKTKSADVEPSHDATKDAAIIQPLSQESGSMASAVSQTIYLTDGELIPWKKTWWKVQLREINGEKIVTLLKGKATAKAQKRSARAERWNTQHSRKAGVKREIAATRAFLKSVSTAGALSGSQESRQEH